jgi:hypothetical protein
MTHAASELTRPYIGRKCDFGWRHAHQLLSTSSNQPMVPTAHGTPTDAPLRRLRRHIGKPLAGLNRQILPRNETYRTRSDATY